MTVRVELLTVFRQKAGADALTVELAPAQGTAGAGRPSVLQALQALRGAELGLLDGSQIKKGVLVFVRTPEGTLHRVFHPDAQGLIEGQPLVLATAMEGG
jgi:hypothetical protein